MKRVNWYFKHSFLLLFVLFIASSCEKQELYIDDNGNIIDNNDGNGNDGNTAQGEEGALSLYAINGNDITKIKDYQVSNDLLSFQQDVVKHQDMWAYFTQLIPLNARVEIVEFEVIHGGGELLGYVTPIDETDLSRWRMGLAIDAIGDLSQVDLKTEFAYTSIHEYGHVLTLNDKQVDAAKGQGSCGTFHTGEGCSNSNSYINELYNIGWADIIDEFNAISNENQAEDFYNKYQDRFVTPYAASNPGEDVAEVFSVFVTADNPPTGNTIADQKVKAMYNHPELVALRDEIRKDAIIRAMRPGSWRKPKCKHNHHNHSKAVALHQ
jgi:hypothetical protein